MVNAILHITQGLISLLTLGIVTKELILGYTIRCAKADLKERIKQNEL